MPGEDLYGLEYNPFGFTPPPPGPDPQNARSNVLARTGSLDALVYELTRYTRQEVEGRSCLIAGPRGSGKTTLIETARDEIMKAGGPRLIRVRLHGPSLLEPIAPAEKDAKPENLYQHVLKTLVINLYQTAAEELSNTYREHMEREHKSPEALELAAQLRITLDGAPSPAKLRFFWERADALSTGVLFTGSGRTRELQPDQGMREIVALATAAEAYRSCTGVYKHKEKEEAVANKKQELKAELNREGKSIAQAFTSLAAGVAAGAAVNVASAALAPSLLGGALTAILSMAALSYSSTRTRETTSKASVTFLPNTEVSSLVHRVPLLLRRFRQADIYPVFVVDELDKIKNLSKLLGDVAGYLKFVCADKAFFCFLTDRSYIAETARINRERTNAVQRTIFTNLLFVLYDTESVHKYLDKVVRPSPNSDKSEDLKLDAEALRYILLQRSRMLLFELRRELNELRNDQGRLKLPLKAPRTTLVHQFHLMLQLAVEVILTGPFVTDRVTRDPDFGQTIYDALYYPTHRWYLGERPLDCSADALIDGMATFSGNHVDLADSEKEFLQAQVTTMLNLVCDPARLESAVRDAVTAKRMSVSLEVREAIPEQPRLLERLDAGDTYRWIYNRYGIPYEAANVTTILNNAALLDSEQTVTGIKETMAQISIAPTAAQVLSTVTEASAFLEWFARLSA